MKNRTRIIFRADGSSRIGLGHVVRSLALADMLRDAYECVFAIQEPGKELEAKIRKVCHGLIVLPQCAPTEDRFLYELTAYVSEEEIVVLDGYHFNTDYQLQLKLKGAALVCIDDIHEYKFLADAVINQAGDIRAEAYTTAPYTKLYLGPKYALLRAPFLNAAKEAYTYPTGKLRLLLNMGGADPNNVTLQLAGEIASIEAIEQLEIVVGSAYLHLAALQAWLKKNSKCQLQQALSAEEMCKLMQSCQAAVTSPSGVAYEYCAAGGILYLYQTAENQAGIYNFLIKEALATPYAGLKASLQPAATPTLHQQYVTQQRRFFDGNSIERLQQLFTQLSFSAKLAMREVRQDDMMLLFHWSSDPAVRIRSFNKEPIPLEVHKIWFQTKLADLNCILYIAELEGEPAAHIRFDIEDNVAIISYLIAENFRGKGLGHTVLQKGIAALRKDRLGIQVVEGLVQQDNTPSVRAFEKAGFTYGAPSVQFPNAFRFVLRPESIV